MKNINDLYPIIDFVLGRMPCGVVVLDEQMSIVYRNRNAELFLDRLCFPSEVEAIARNMFDAIRVNKFKQLFPGEVKVYSKIEGSPSRWTFHFHIYEKGPLVCVFINEEAPSEKVDLNKLRRYFRLTRRENDVVRRVINGLNNDDIAKELNISGQTIKDHLSNAYQKIGVSNRVELLSFLFNSRLSTK